MTTQQPEALRLADICATKGLFAVEDELRRLHAESEQHMQELRSYRITVDNREARIAELEAQLAVPQPPEAACNLSMQPELATEAAAEHEALRSVYEAARGLLRYEGVDDGRAITYRSKLASAIEEVKHIDSGLWEPPEANSAEFDRIKTAPVQMPEPVGVAHCGQLDNVKDGYAYVYPVGSVGADCKLYTEHQVRQLLAQHGIK